MTDTKELRELLAKAIEKSRDTNGDMMDFGPPDALLVSCLSAINRLTAERDAAYARGREDAAAIAERCTDDYEKAPRIQFVDPRGFENGAEHGSRYIATAIRANKEK